MFDAHGGEENLPASPRPTRWRSNLPEVLWAAAILALIAALLVAVTRNAFGTNIEATVRCANGEVTGAYVAAGQLDWVPATGENGYKSGFATARRTETPGEAKVSYWLPLGGR